MVSVESDRYSVLRFSCLKRLFINQPAAVRTNETRFIVEMGVARQLKRVRIRHASPNSRRQQNGCLWIPPLRELAHTGQFDHDVGIAAAVGGFLFAYIRRLGVVVVVLVLHNFGHCWDCFLQQDLRINDPFELSF